MTEDTTSITDPETPESLTPSALGGNYVGTLESFAPQVKRAILVWDAPNLDMSLSSILGHRLTALVHPRFDAPGRWLLTRTAEVAACYPDNTIELEATVFTNTAPGSADVVQPWVAGLRNMGFPVFVKLKIDVDRDMLTHIEQRYNEGRAALVVASANSQTFRQPLEEITRAGIDIQMIEFREHTSWTLTSDTLEIVDLEDIADVFREPLPRIGLDSLPEQGAWLQPFPAAVCAIELVCVTLAR